MIMVNWSVKCW